eukprot:9584444-Ditylum_brightwellii.AAC.1
MSTLALAHGKRSSFSTIVPLALVARFVFAAISHCNRLPSCKSSLGLPFQEKVQDACFVA